ncbi:conserved hypothetical protein [Isorropodon fossajaponicum endosymbiont JTNG4]|uniref:NAD(P)/FAD-dependent oxidoreductase n=1 Tax=Isorropodon fossajaponicum symbiont TaxID=883811 RepID=UPI001938A89A|nr:conserved hypothetical protein [Isorropodon fossajaponicum endosymbiont JTNG4]
MPYEVVIIGAGAAGLMCAIEAGKRHKKVLVIDKANKAGKKILISGGGRCNFTNLAIEPEAYLSHNPHFHKSALARYTQWDFIKLMNKHNLSWHEKTQGQLFCDQKSAAILQMLLNECIQVGVDFVFNVLVTSLEFDTKYNLKTNQGDYQANTLVIATGGASIPKIGATDFGLQVAKQFNINTTDFTPALVPLTFHVNDINRYFKGLSGLSLEVVVGCNGQSFRDFILITHKGISGPAILQISLFWHSSDKLSINLLPDIDATDWLIAQQQTRGKATLKTVLSVHFPKRLAQRLANTLLLTPLENTPLGQINKSELSLFGRALNNWQLYPNAAEGLRVAEVCLGGVDTNELSSKTMQVKKQPSLYFIGETVDVTGQLGGYNFQWAWSSGWVAGQMV